MPVATWWNAVVSNPEWWQVILIVVGTAIAAAAFLAERRAVRLTQRADLLGNTVDVSTGRNPITAETQIRVEFKNYGPTRASDVQLRAWLEFAEIKGPKDGPSPRTVLGAGDTQEVVLDRFGTFMTREIATAVREGRIDLHLFVEATYADVFGKRHSTRERAIYRADARCFEVVSRSAD